MEFEDRADLTVIDLDDLDDLSQPDHIDWNSDQIESFTLDALDTNAW